MQPLKERKRVTLAYVGRRLMKGGVLGHLYLRVKDASAASFVKKEKDMDAVVLFKKPVHGFGRPGKVFSIEETEDQVFLNTVEKVGWFPAELAAIWDGVSQATEGEHRMMKEEKKIDSMDPLSDSLLIAKEAFRELRTRRQREVFLARIIDTITRGHGL